MNIVVVGLGYVGVTTSACLADEGHSVIGVDVSQKKVDDINVGISPIREPMVAELVRLAVADGRLRASTTLGDLSDTELVIVCVGTPSAPDGSHNMSYIAEATRQIASALVASPSERKTTVAYRSTFKPGTMDGLVSHVMESHLGADLSGRVELVYNPEFLRESTAVADFRKPPKVVIGTSDGRPSNTMATLHRSLDSQVFYVKFREAEITKFVDNTWHSAKVAFANEIGRICVELGISARKVHEIFISDTKLNLSSYYTRPGGAFGGSCLPKDVRALNHMATSVGVEAGLIGSILISNLAHQKFQFDRVVSLVRPGARLLLVGLAFKAGTDDLRESPNLTLASQLLNAGYDLDIFDPAVRPELLLGANLGHTFAVLPELRDRLLSAEVIELSTYELVITANASRELLDLSAVAVLDLEVLP